MPRWSLVTAHWSGAILSIAGLPGGSAWVRVGPPLSAKATSRGSVFTRSPLVPPQLPSLERLLPAELTPTQLPPLALSATIVLRSVTLPENVKMPLPNGAELPLNVLLVIVTLGGIEGAPAVVTRPPPKLTELLFETVLFVIFQVPPAAKKAPPSLISALLATNVLPAIVTVPAA